MGIPTLAAVLVAAAQLHIGPTRDSARVVRNARSAQTSFEMFRRLRLPGRPSYGGTCDMRIGRYCYWRGEDEEDERAPEEAAAIRERRDALIGTLDSAFKSFPGDSWVAGQLVRYLVEAGRTEDALAAARTCRARASWCAALAGYTAHAADQYGVADSAYRVALDSMPAAERCEWLDVSELIEDDLADKYEKLDCPAREAMSRRIFWLGSPLLSVSSSDLLTEHLARITRAHIAEHSASTDGESWADDVRSMMVRYGWPRWYSKSEPGYGSLQSPSVTGHDSGKPYDFLPSLHALEHPGEIDADDWDLDDNRARTGYAPSFAKSVHVVPGQIAAFWRGDSTLVIAAWDVRQDTTLVGRELDAALVLADSVVRVTERASKERAVGRISATGLLDSGIVSLELMSNENHRAGRMRVGLPARAKGPVGLSDLLLYSANAGTVTDVSAARDSALATSVLPMSKNVGVFWEMYGFEPQGKPAKFSLTIEEVDKSWRRRFAEGLHISDPTRALRIEWSEAPSVVDGIASRALKLDLSKLRSGKYRVQLTVTPATGWPATSERRIEIP